MRNLGSRNCGLRFLKRGSKRSSESGANETKIITERILGLVRGHSGSDLGHDGSVGRATSSIKTVVRDKRIFLLFFLFQISEGFMVHTIRVLDNNAT